MALFYHTHASNDSARLRALLRPTASSEEPAPGQLGSALAALRLLLAHEEQTRTRSALTPRRTQLAAWRHSSLIGLRTMDCGLEVEIHPSCHAASSYTLSPHVLTPHAPHADDKAAAACVVYRYDEVLFSRFDVWYKRPVREWNLRTGKFNVPFKQPGGGACDAG